MALNETGLSVGDERDGYRVSRVINATTGRYVWQAIATSGTGDVENVTPTPVPVDLAALEVAVPAAGQPVGTTWESVYGTPGNYAQARIVGGAWVPTGAAGGAMVGATAALVGTGGTVPAPPAGSQDLVLHGDGLWRQQFPNWTANTAYSQGAVVFQNQRIYRRIAAGSSGLTFDATEAGLWQIVADHGNPDLFLTATAVAAADPANPTLAEIDAAAATAGAADQIIVYSGTDLDTDPVTYAYHIDTLGAVVALRSPSAGVSPATSISPAADDGTGEIGSAALYAREDHKHPAQAPSADAGNLVGVGTDGLHLLDPAVLFADAVSPAADDAAGEIGTATQAAREDHKHPAQGVSADADNDLTVGADGLHYFADIDEVVESAGPLAGAAPVGAQWGVDTTAGQAYYVTAGNWTAMPVVTVDLNFTVASQAGQTAGAAPITPPAGPDTGDVHLEVYDDALVWWNWTGAAWASAAQLATPATSILTADLTADADHTQGFADHTQTWTNLGGLVIDQGLAAIPGAFGSTTLNTGGFVVNSNGAPGVTADLDVQPNTARLAGASGTEAGGIEFTQSPNARTRVHYSSTSGAGSDAAVHVDVDGVDLVIGATEDLRINGAPGATGDVLTSQGPDLPPLWVPAAAAGPWQYSTGATTVADGDRWVVGGPHAMTFPASPSNGQSVQFVPGNGDWDTLGASFTTTDTATVAAGQTDISSGADVVEFIYNATTDNWAAYSNGAGPIAAAGGGPTDADVITFPDQNSFTQGELQALYDGVAGGPAPDTPPQEVNDYLATISGPAPDYYLYLGHNQWMYTSAPNPTAGDWLVFGGGGKSTFSAAIHFPDGLVTAKP